MPLHRPAILTRHFQDSQRQCITAITIGRTQRYDYDPTKDLPTNHKFAAAQLAAAFKWSGQWHTGAGAKREYYHVFDEGSFTIAEEIDNSPWGKLKAKIDQQLKQEPK